MRFYDYFFALTLLRNSISVPKLLYTLRSSNCSENPLLVTFDTLQRKCLTDVINIDLNEDQWTQATLSIWDEDLGIRSVAMLAPSAFLASATSTLQIQNDIQPARFHGVPDNAQQFSRVFFVTALSHSFCLTRSSIFGMSVPESFLHEWVTMSSAL